MAVGEAGAAQAAPLFLSQATYVHPELPHFLQCRSLSQSNSLVIPRKKQLGKGGHSSMFQITLYCSAGGAVSTKRLYLETTPRKQDTFGLPHLQIPFYSPAAYNACYHQTVKYCTGCTLYMYMYYVNVLENSRYQLHVHIYIYM